MWYVRHSASRLVFLHSSVFRSFRSVALHWKCKYFSPSVVVTAWQHEEKCTVNKNVPRQHNQCPQRYKTQYRPVRVYIMQLQWALKTATQAQTTPWITTTAPLQTSYIIALFYFFRHYGTYVCVYLPSNMVTYIQELNGNHRLLFLFSIQPSSR